MIRQVIILYKTRRITIKIRCKFLTVKLNTIININRIIIKVKNSDNNFIIKL